MLLKLAPKVLLLVEYSCWEWFGGRSWDCLHCHLTTGRSDCTSMEQHKTLGVRVDMLRQAKGLPSYYQDMAPTVSTKYDTAWSKWPRHFQCSIYNVQLVAIIHYYITFFKCNYQQMTFCDTAWQTFVPSLHVWPWTPVPNYISQKSKQGFWNSAKKFLPLASFSFVIILLATLNKNKINCFRLNILVQCRFRF